MTTNFRKRDKCWGGSEKQSALELSRSIGRWALERSHIIIWHEHVVPFRADLSVERKKVCRCWSFVKPWDTFCRQSSSKAEILNHSTNKQHLLTASNTSTQLCGKLQPCHSLHETMILWHDFAIFCWQMMNTGLPDFYLQMTILLIAQ